MIDIILMFASICLSYSLIPQIIKCIKNKSCKDLSWQFIIITIIALTIMSCCLFAEKLYFSSISNFLTVIAYIIIMFLKFHYDYEKIQ
jgi:uncharacterized protein with PQ loop repeat